MLPRLISFVIFGCFALTSPALAQGDPNWTRAFPPFRIIGNIYRVGSYDLSTYLITTPQGNILINTGGRPRSRSRRAWNSSDSSSPTPKS